MTTESRDLEGGNGSHPTGRTVEKAMNDDTEQQPAEPTPEELAAEEAEYWERLRMLSKHREDA